MLKKILKNARGFLEELGFLAINHRGKISNPRLSPNICYRQNSAIANRGNKKK